MNLNQMVHRVLRAGRLPSRIESHAKQQVKDVINEAIQEILVYSNEWSFMLRTKEILSLTGIENYALPTNCGSIVRVGYDGLKLEIFYPGNADQYTQHDSVVAATVTYLTESAYGNSGYVYPTFGLSDIAGVQCAFDSSVVGRFFKSEMDGEIYRISAFTDENNIVLDNEYGGKTQAGRVSVIGTTSDELKVIYGNIHTTNFQEWMIGKYLQIEGNGSTIFTIVNVDEDRQRIMVDQASVAGTDLIFSIQDNYEVDPAGAGILTLASAAPETDKIIAVDYYESQPPLTSPFQVPIIPARFHYVIVAAALQLWMTDNPIEGVHASSHQRRKEAGIAAMLQYEDMISDAVGFAAEPDPVRMANSNILG